NVNDAPPKIFIRQVLFPMSEIFVVESGKLRCHPGFSVYAISHAGDRHFVLGYACPNILPQPTAHFLMQFAHPISMATQTQGKNGHAKWIVRIQARLTKGEKFLERN